MIASYVRLPVQAMDSHRGLADIAMVHDLSEFGN